MKANCRPFRFLSEGQIVKKLKEEGIPCRAGDIFRLHQDRVIQGYVFKKKAMKFEYDEVRKVYLE